MNPRRASEAATRERVPGPYDAGVILAQLGEVHSTIAALPGTRCCPLSPLMSLLVGRAAAESTDEEPLRASPTLAAVRAAEDVLSWLDFLPRDDPPRERTIVALRLAGLSWERVGAKVGLTGEGTRRAHAIAVQLIANELNRRTWKEAA